MTTRNPTNRTLTDTEALDRIHALLDGQLWGPDTLDDIACVLTMTGRAVDDPDDFDSDDVCDDFFEEAC